MHIIAIARYLWLQNQMIAFNGLHELIPHYPSGAAITGTGVVVVT